MSETFQHHAALASLFLFYQDSGVDCAVLEAPVNRFAAEAPPARQPGGQPAGQRVPPQAPAVRAAAPAGSGIVLAADLAIEAARVAAAQARSLDDLHQIIDAFTGCALKTTATRSVFAGGSREARVMIVGDAPGREDDLSGVPFSDAAGGLLAKALAHIGLGPDDVYCCPLLPWRPPGGREATAHEMAVCLPFIQRHVALKQPQVLLCLGDRAAQGLMQVREGILKTRGQWMDIRFDGFQGKAMASISPGNCLKTPAMKKLLWRDMLALKAALERSH